MYMNDFEKCLENCTPNLYADDTSVTCFAEDLKKLCNSLQNELTNISEWMKMNLKNTKKSEFMIIGHKRQLNRIQYPIHLDIGGEEIKRVHEVKYLGVSVDESLSWIVKYSSTISVQPIFLTCYMLHMKFNNTSKNYIIKKMAIIAIRALYYIFCKCNKA